MPEVETGGSTVADIAKTLVTSASPEPISEETVLAPDTEELEAVTEATEVDDTEEEDVEASGDDIEEDSDEDILDEDEADEGALFKVIVDGEEIEVSQEELVRSYSLNKAAHNNLQQAKEIRKNAEAEGRAAAQQESAQRTEALVAVQQNLDSVLQNLGQQFFAPQVEAPPPEMEQTDPIGYLTQAEAYRRDQTRIQNMVQQVQGVMGQTQQQVVEQQASLKQAHQAQLFQKRPDLKESESAQVFTSRVRAAAAHAGYSAEEIDNHLDHRALLVLEGYGKYLETQAAKEQGSPAKREVQKARKALKPGAAAVSNRSKSSKMKQAARDRAKKTGRPEDVAKTLYL